jgi:hypothetical protein
MKDRLESAHNGSDEVEAVTDNCEGVGMKKLASISPLATSPIQMMLDARRRQGRSIHVSTLTRCGQI